MKTISSDKYTRELRDDDLRDLLRTAFADDPALEESPGRTERILRRIKAEEVRPRGWFTWQPFAWAGGLATTIAVAVAIALRVLAPAPLLVENTAPAPNNNIVIPQPTPPDVKPEFAPNPLPEPKEMAPAPPKDRVIVQRVPRPKPQPRPKPAPPAITPQPVAEEPVEEIAAAYFNTGKAATMVGDNEMAFYAYQASYETMPTPESLLASSRALEAMTEIALASEG